MSRSAASQALVREPRRTHQVQIDPAEVVVISSVEGDEALTLSVGGRALQVDAAAAEALASTLLAHAERLLFRVGA